MNFELTDNLYRNASEADVQSVHPATLGELFADAGLVLPQGADAALSLRGFTDDSRAVGVGDLFIAVRGESVDGHQYIESAIERGAVAVLVDSGAEESCLQDAGIQSLVLRLDNTRLALGKLAQAWYGNPSRKMCVVGVTGTNGKTTTAWLIWEMLCACGLPAALISTVEYRYAGQRFAAPNTTPGSLSLAEAMANALRSGEQQMVMEVSSHALQQSRVEGIGFDVAVMSNLTQDHLDYHLSMEEYARAKQRLFSDHAPGVAVFNKDDATACEFLAAHDGDSMTYSLQDSSADLMALNLDVNSSGVSMNLQCGLINPESSLALVSSLRGRFNASNLLAAAAVGLALGLEANEVIGALCGSRGAPGRFEAIDEGQSFDVYVDYAHTPDAVERILENVRVFTSGRLIVVLGCGGDRDADKRPKMGAAMGRLADYCFVTNDNPRSEDPAVIAGQIEEGLRSVVDDESSYAICLDRGQAIKRALQMAQSGDAVVIAGKGHEDYQEVCGERLAFDDRVVAREVLRSLV